MTLPAEITAITVRGTYLRADGTPAAGYIAFTPSVPSVSPSSDPGVIIPMSRVIAQLDTSGAFQLTLAATDDPDVEPVGWTYSVRESIANVQRLYSIEVPHDTAGGVLDLADATPVEDVDDVSPFARLAVANVFTEPQTLKSTADQTSRITIQSYQPFQFGEGVRLDLLAVDAKNMIAWRDVFTDPDNPRTIAWIGAHDELPNGNVHRHISIEVPDSTGAMQTRFEVPYGTQDVLGLDITNIKTHKTDFTVLVNNGQVLRLAALNQHNKDLVWCQNSDGSSDNPRWAFRVDNTTETGGNAGSNWHLLRFDDAGDLLAHALFVDRSNGQVGVNTEDPIAQLHIEYDGSFPGIFVRNTAAGASIQASLRVQASDAGTRVEDFRLPDDVTARHAVYMDGKHEWGSGTVRDTNLYRAKADTLATDDDLSFPTESTGPVLTDRTTGTQYRLFVDNGVLDIEALP